VEAPQSQQIIMEPAAPVYIQQPQVMQAPMMTMQAPMVTMQAPMMTMAAPMPMAATQIGNTMVVGQDLNRDGIPDVLEQPVQMIETVAPTTIMAAPTTMMAAPTMMTTMAAPMTTTYGAAPTYATTMAAPTYF